MLGKNNKIKVGIINLGLNNLYSIYNCIKNDGYVTSVINPKIKKINSDILVIPGVGSFPKAMEHIKKYHLDSKIFELKERSKVIFGICLGMQILFESSDEFKYTKGISLIEGKVKKLSNKNLIVPNIGWHKIKNIKKNSFIPKNVENKHFYFVHSYFCKPRKISEITSITKINKFSFCSSIQKKKIFGTQFHPEKSGNFGVKIIKNLRKFL